MLLGALGALLGVLAVVVLAGGLIRRVGPRLGLALPGVTPAGRGPRRLALLEVLPVDPRRRLLLLRCDGREILLLTGGPQDLLLSAGEAVEARP
jgi:flagellar protein FliO/FliZ